MKLEKKKYAKKTIILYVLKILQEGSSKEKPLTYTSMTKVLNSIGITCDRKTVKRNVDYLIDFGYKIVILESKKGCYLEQ